MKKSFTKQQLDELTTDQLKQMVMCTNDGQGDTRVKSVEDMRGWYVDGNGHSLDDPEGDPTNEIVTNSKLIDILWSDTNGNMTTFIWIENNSFETINFI